MALRLLIALLVLAVPMELPGCGPFPHQALFSLTLQPEKPEEEFARGQLGVVQPNYARRYLVIAYRHLAGVGLNQQERWAAFPASPDASMENPWLTARNQVPGVKPLSQIDPNRQVKRDGFFEYYLNCNEDAFRTAAATLAARIQQYGASSSVVADWVAAQDQVFANCSSGASIPSPASDPRLRADRTYQIAAARFYAEQYDSARQDFQSIGADSESPWHEIAPYLAARCLIRAGELAEAEAELKRIGTPPAGRLLGYVRAHLYPEQRIHELGQALMKPGIQESIAQDLTDYRLLFDTSPPQSHHDDLTDWIVTFQSGSRDHALEKWRETRSLPWLVAALQTADSGDTATPDLLGASREVKPDSPGYVTAGFHAVRLMPEAKARSKADELLRLKMPVSARNLIRAERMRLARSFDEFLQYAPRTAVGELTDMEEAKPVPGEHLDADSADVLNRLIPLPLLKQASEGRLLPAAIRRDLAGVVFVRSMLLTASPSFDDIFTLLKSPGLRAYVDTGFGRETRAEGAIDSFRDNWWCAFTAKPDGRDYYRARAEMSSALRGLYRKGTPAAPFLPAPDREQARKEWELLRSLPSAPDWLTQQTLAWAEKSPSDPRIPEALHLCVRASRYGCSDDKTGDFSHQAFDLLHKRYPTTEWARKTPYWYN